MKKLLIFSSIVFHTVLYGQFGYQTVGNTVGVPNISNAVCGEVDSCFTLTPNQLSQSGAVWDNKPINLNYSFDATFCMTLGAEDMWGADGFAFVMRSEESDSMGQVGSGLGFLGIEPSLAIEFDTYQNTDINDPAADHTALYFNGDFLNPLAGPVSLLPGSGNVENGGYHQSRIVWNANTQELKMYFDGFLRFTYVGDIVNDFFGGDNTILWGFTASTGALSNLQQICFPRYQVDLDDISVCAGDSAAVHFYNESMTSYRWTYEDGTVIKNWNTLDFVDPFDLDDTLFYTTQAGTYYLNVEINNQMVTDSLEVSFINPPAEPFANKYDMACLEDETYVLNALNPGSAYLWSTGSGSQQITLTQAGEYSVRITEPVAGCITRDTITLISFCKDTSICEGETVPVSFYHPDVTAYSWTHENGTVITDWNGLPDPFDLDDTAFVAALAGTYYFDVEIEGQLLQDSLELTIVPLPEEPFADKYDIACLADDNYTLSAENNGSTYQWSTGETSQSIMITNPGEYAVRIFEPALSCSADDTIKVMTFCKDTMICDGQSVPVSFYEPGITMYNWAYEGMNITLQPFDLDDTLISISQAGTYYLDFVIGGQLLQDSLELIVIPAPESPFASAEITVCLDEQAHELDALNTGAFYFWSTGDTTQTISVTEAGLYAVEIIEPNLVCTTKDSITVISLCKTEITFPNIFTPNGDNSNDYYELIFSNSPQWVADFEMQIFNRWGQEIFTTGEQLVKWDGKMDGLESEEGVYFYRYTYKDVYTGEINSGHGNFQLIR